MAPARPRGTLIPERLSPVHIFVFLGDHIEGNFHLVGGSRGSVTAMQRSFEETISWRRAVQGQGILFIFGSS